MKNTTFITAILLLFTGFIFAQQTYVPDDNFENYLETHDANGYTVPLGDPSSMGNGIANDDYVTTANINTVTGLYVYGLGINDLTGIEDFAALTTLYCYSNQLTNLDVSANTALTYLNCQNNQLTGLDVSTNTALGVLYCYDNQLTNLDVSANTALTTLYCNINQLTSLDLSQNTALENLGCEFNQLTSLDVSQNTFLQYLDCYDNQLTNIDVSQNIALQYFRCYSNQLTNLDMRNGNNANLTYFFATNNPNLTCVFVDDAGYMNTNWANAIDTTATYVATQAECDALAQTYVPDDNFENYLETHDANGNTVPIGDPFSMGNGIANDDYVTTANISGVTNLNVNNQNIADMTGIEDFTSLENFRCNGNLLTALDLSQNTALQYLYCEENQLTSLSLPQNTALVHIECFSNQLTGIDLSQNTGLLRFYCWDNQLTSLDLSQNTALLDLECGNNQLTGLDLSQNTALQYLECENNQLTSLDVSQNTALQYLGCYDNQLTSLNVSQNTVLQQLRCQNNQLTSIDISQDIALQYFKCDSNQLTSLDVTQNTVLRELYCDSNQLTSIDVSQNTDLIALHCNFNQISSIDISQNPAIFNFHCASNQLINLDMRNGNNTNLYSFLATNNPNLTCVFVDDAGYMNTNWANAIDTTATYVETQAECDALAQTYTPDDNFENYLETHDANGSTVPIGDPSSMGNGIANDDYVTTSRINTVTNLDVAYLSIADLTGIEDFTALTNLSCHHNNLTALDVTQNVSLTELYCNNNQITSLDVSQNTALTKLYCYQNQLSALDVSQNTSLTDLRCYNNQLTGLDVTANVAVQILEFGNNAISSIDLTQNSALQSIQCSDNQLTGLDVSQNTVLQAVACNNNQLTSLDIRNGNNANLYNFTAIGNPNLTCVFVDDKTYMNANWTNAIDATATYVETQTECNTLAVSNSILEQAITIYPIPAKERLTVKSGINGKYKMYDYTGKRILKGSILIGENSIPLQQCSKGIYFMEIIANKTSIIKKIVVE